MRIENIFKFRNRASKANNLELPVGWYKPEIQSARKMDLIDDAVISMIRAIQTMNGRGIPFSIEIYKALIDNYISCAKLSYELKPAERSAAIKILKARTSTADLKEILHRASKQ